MHGNRKFFYDCVHKLIERHPNNINYSSLSSILNMLLFAGVFSKAITLRNCEKQLSLNIRIFKAIYEAVLL